MKYIALLFFIIRLPIVFVLVVLRTIWFESGAMEEVFEKWEIRQIKDLKKWYENKK